MEIARGLDDVLAVLFPGACPCGARGEPCCARCRAALLPAPEVAPPPGVEWWSAPFAYAGVARELVARAKYRNARASLAWLGAAIAEHLPRAHSRDIVTWVPASRARRRGSGVDHGELLAREVARRIRIPARPLLCRAPGPAQTGAGRAERRRGPALRAIGPCGLRVLVVDDVATTGASLGAAARALRAAGARSVAAATATRTPAPGQP